MSRSLLCERKTRLRLLSQLLDLGEFDDGSTCLRMGRNCPGQADLFIYELVVVAACGFCCGPGIANGLALVFGGGPKIDLGKNFVDGKRMLGDGKSFMGAAAGVFFGLVGVAAVQIFLPQLTAFLPINYLQYGFLLAFHGGHL